jgi:uncharacterized protein YecE (DUF72 family)
VAQRFFALLRELHRGSIVIEPRHVSWFTVGADRVLKRNAVSRVAADPALNAQLAGRAARTTKCSSIGCTDLRAYIGPIIPEFTY